MEHQPESPDPNNPFVAPHSGSAKPPGFPEVGEARSARVRFDAIGEAWELMSRARGTWALMVLVFYAIIFAVVFGILIVFGLALAGLGAANRNAEPGAAAVLVVFLFYIVIIGVSLVVQGFLTAGMFRAACRQLRGEPIRMMDLFSAGDVVWPFTGGMILMWLAVAAGEMLCIIPGLLIAGRLMFVPALIADGRMGPVEAIGASWRALHGQSWLSFFFVFVAGILAGLGAFLCGIGIVLTFPIYIVSVAIVYNDFFPRSKAAQSPWIEPV